MPTQPKLQRIFRLIALLKGSFPYKIDWLARSLGVSERTIYRDIEVLESCGFWIDKDFKDRYFICQDNKALLPAFSLEEARLLKKAILNSPEIAYLQEGLIRKIYIHSEQYIAAQNILAYQQAQNCHKIITSISEKRQVKLIDYHSSNSNSIKDRLVEPVGFSNDFKTFTAFDIDDKRNKHFKIDRISKVEVLEATYQYQEHHKVLDCDVFGINGDGIQIKLKLSLRAYNLFREEYPSSGPYLYKEQEGNVFHGKVNGFEGIGRFVLGLPGEVEILEPSEFKQYLRKRRNKEKF